jgi:Arc/MetJ-type ribon-helix-helix transcriptional regulator
MTIDLKPKQQRVIDLAVKSGAYRNPGEVLDQAFEIIREQLDLQGWMLGQREEVAAHIAMGFAQAERGDLVEGDAVAEILRQRRAERLKPQR